MARYSKIPLSTEGGALERYLEEISHLDPLSREEEQKLGSLVQEGDEQARERLVQANLRFVVTIAKEYLNHGMPLSDLISEGNLGLIEASTRFDPSRGFKFISYAVWWIRHAILSALADRGRPVRIPQNQAQRLHRISQDSRRLEQEKGRKPILVDIAEELEVALEHVESSIAIGRRPRSLDAPMDQADEGRSLLDVMDSGQQTPEKEAIDTILHEKIQGTLNTLDEQEAEIVRLYYGIEGRVPMTLDEIAQRYGLTRERIRQIRERALSRLRHPSRAGRLKEFWEN